MRVRRIGDLFTIAKGKKYEDTQANAANEMVRYIQIEDLRNDNNIKMVNKIENGVYVTSNDVLIAWDGANAGTIGYNLTGIIGSTLAVLRPRDSDNYIPYIAMFLRSKNSYLRDNCTGATIPHINKKVLEDIEVPLPSYDQQKEIAYLLDKAQALIDKRKQAISKLDELVQAVFLDMFGDPVKNLHNYTVVKMDSILDFLTSGSRGWAQYFTSSGDLFITIKNVKNGRLWLDDMTYVKAPNTKEAERTKVKYRDLLLSITADLGRTAVVDEYTADKGAHINQHLSILRLNQRCNPYYMAHYLESAGGKIQFASLDQVGVKSGLNFNAIKSLNVILPPIEEQNRFEANLKKIQQEKEKQLKSLQHLESNFQALLQKAFKGELKVKDGVVV
ncbi:hypothetical protein A7K91_11200 [Paenibacillus oryzae]|uniref:Type I restriction modification DNA specificity domain-containing protein n=1 Tax=Paenibacillus oryzae TaxID=1844972 RepID=A0A1A5YEE4_9BACL|nr:restriction endonuclease subunit S [Paenibacillus oryzae]OBR63954.1 hypothetical protein A7K91_11200 [Paenibacillus oryzae]